MIKISKFVILYPLLPMAVLSFMRFMFFLSGAEWKEPENTVLLSVVVGLIFAVCCHAILIESRDHWGYWRIGRGPDDD